MLDLDALADLDVAFAIQPDAVPGLTRDLLSGLEEVPGQARDSSAPVCPHLARTAVK